MIDTHEGTKDHEVLQAMPRHEFSNRLLGKVGVTGLGDEGQELVELLIGLEGIASQLVDRADGVRAGGVPDQLIERQQVITPRSLRCSALVLVVTTSITVLSLMPHHDG